MLSDQDIKEYQQIYKKVYNAEISVNEAREQGSRLLNFFRIILSEPKHGSDEMKLYGKPDSTKSR